MTEGSTRFRDITYSNLEELEKMLEEDKLPKNLEEHILPGIARGKDFTLCKEHEYDYLLGKITFDETFFLRHMKQETYLTEIIILSKIRKMGKDGNLSNLYDKNQILKNIKDRKRLEKLNEENKEEFDALDLKERENRSKSKRRVENKNPSITQFHFQTSKKKRFNYNTNKDIEYSNSNFNQKNSFQINYEKK